MLDYEDELNQLREAAGDENSSFFVEELEDRRWEASGKQILDDLKEALEQKGAELEAARGARDACGLRAILMATAWLRHGTWP